MLSAKSLSTYCVPGVLSGCEQTAALPPGAVESQTTGTSRDLNSDLFQCFSRFCVAGFWELCFLVRQEGPEHVSVFVSLCHVLLQ